MLNVATRHPVNGVSQLFPVLVRYRYDHAKAAVALLCRCKNKRIAGQWSTSGTGLACACVERCIHPWRKCDWSSDRVVSAGTVGLVRVRITRPSCTLLTFVGGSSRFVWRETQAILSAYDAEEGLEGSSDPDTSPMLGPRRGSVRRSRSGQLRSDTRSDSAPSRGPSGSEYVSPSLAEAGRTTTPGRGEREADSLLLVKDSGVDDSAVSSSSSSPDPATSHTTDDSSNSTRISHSFNTTDGRTSSPSSRAALTPAQSSARSTEPTATQDRSGSSSEEPFDWGWDERVEATSQTPSKP